MERTELGNLKFPIHYYTRNHNVIDIEGYINDFELTELKEGSAYIFEENVYIYKKKLPKVVKEKMPFIYYDKDEASFFAFADINGTLIPVSEVLENRFAMLCNATTEDMDFQKDVAAAPQASSSAIYTPVIEETDDFLKRLIKMIFLIKKVPTTRYRKKITKTYQFSNLFQALNNATKTSTPVWQTWIELLGMDCIIILKDAKVEPEEPCIDNYLVYKSRNDVIDIVKPEEITDYLSDIL